MKAVVFTLGCKVNGQESAALMNGLIERGYEVSDKLEYADIYIINTCAVTAEAEKKSRQAIARALKFNKDASVYVCGCASQHAPEDFFNKGVKVVVGAKAKDKLLDLLDNEGCFIEQGDEYYEKYFPCKTSHTRSYIKIQDGCNNFCSYCLIPYLRGRSRSRSVENIRKEIELLSPVEAVITGINISDYHCGETDLAGLLEQLCDFDCRIRLGSLEVCVIDRRLLGATKKLKDFAPHFHLSLQSGSDAVLKSMNRHYTTDVYAEKVELIREYYPNAAITTDIIVGYSTESEEDFLGTLAFCERVRFADIHCFPYSVRSGTVGAKLKQLPADVKKQRLKILSEKKEILKKSYLESMMGAVVEWIGEDFTEGYLGGYSSEYIRVYVKDAPAAQRVNVKIIGYIFDGVLGELV